MKQTRLTAVEAGAIYILANELARATGEYTLRPTQKNDEAVKKADKDLRDFVFKLAGGE